jgi:glutamine synthetase
MTDPGHTPAQRYARLATGSVGFAERHGRWSDAQHAAAEQIDGQLGGLDLVRVVYGDVHGLVRSKALSVGAFRTALRNGLDFSPGPFVFDTGHAVAIDFFTESAGIGIAELTGAGDLIVVPDPLTFRVLPHPEAAVGWIIGDEYLRDGTPHPLSSRAVLRQQATKLAERSLDLVIGLELEWTLTRFTDGGRPVAIGGFGIQGVPPAVEVVNAGYQFNLDCYLDQLMPLIVRLSRALQEAGLPLRTVEHESGPGQIECTFDPMSCLAAADSVLLIRSLIKQVCARQGYHASFMALPALPGLDPSGWHLHQSLFGLHTGRNAFAGDGGQGLLSDTGRHYVGGLLAHAAQMSLLCVPTVNGYRRMAGQFSLSPDHAVWSVENRGSFIRALGAPGDESTHVENRVGEPCANPYLYIAAQAAAGTDGIDRETDPGTPVTDPHDTSAKPLPRSLAEALAALEAGTLSREFLGDPLWRAMLLLKGSELARYEKWAAGNGEEVARGQVSDWEHREYFGAF